MKKHTFRASKSHQLRTAGFLFVCALALSSCGGGGGGEQPAPIVQTEVINGFTVPVAPDPVKNAATIQGVDSNNNAVRDDVERAVAAKSSSTAVADAQLTIARALEGDIQGENTVSVEAYNTAVCTLVNGEEKEYIESLILNTKEREAEAARVINNRETPQCGN